MRCKESGRIITQDRSESEASGAPQKARIPDRDPRSAACRPCGLREECGRFTFAFAPVRLTVQSSVCSCSGNCTILSLHEKGRVLFLSSSFLSHFFPHPHSFETKFHSVALVSLELSIGWTRTHKNPPASAS